MWLYTRGVPNPELDGRSLRWAFDPWSASHWVGPAARFLGRRVRSVDMYRFQREIIAATEPVEGCPLAYVESRARQFRGGSVNVAFHLFVREPDGSVRGTELHSYNPYFGCEVGYLGWWDEAVVLVYREKHRTYVCQLPPAAPAVFTPIADDWTVTAGEIAHRKYGETVVRRLSLPDLGELPPLSPEEARTAGLWFPADAHPSG